MAGKNLRAALAAVYNSAGELDEQALDVSEAMRRMTNAIADVDSLPDGDNKAAMKAVFYVARRMGEVDAAIRQVNSRLNEIQGDLLESLEFDGVVRKGSV